MEASVLAQRLLALQGGSIMVVGDVMLDRFVDGTVSRLSPEAPVPILEKALDIEVRHLQQFYGLL